MPFDLSTAKEVKQDIAADELSSGGFNLDTAKEVEVPNNNQSYFLEEKERTIDAPAGMQENQINFLDEIQNDEGTDTAQYFGFNRLFKKTAEVVALPFKGAAGTAVNLGATGEAGSQMKIADAIHQGLNNPIDALYQKRSNGENLTTEERGALMQDIAARSNPFSFLFQTPEGIVESQARKSVRQNNTKDIKNFSDKEDKLRISVSSIRKNADQIIEKHFSRPKEEQSTLAERVLYDFGGVTTTIAASIGLAVVTKNPIASATMFSQLQESSIYLEARDAGVDIDSSLSKARLAGKVEGGLEFVGLNYFFKIAKTSKGVSKHLFRMAEEAAQEYLQTGAEEVITQSSGIRDVDIEGGFKNAAYSAFLGSIGGGATSVMMDTLTKQVVEDTNGKITQKQAKEFLQKVVGETQNISDIVADEISKEAGATKSQADASATEQALSFLEDFSNGRDIDISKLDRDSFEAIMEMKAEHVASKKAKIEEQSLGVVEKQIKDFSDKRIAILENEASKIKTELEGAEGGELVSSLNKRLSKVNSELDSLIVDAEEVGARKLVQTAGQTVNQTKDSVKKIKSALNSGVRASRKDVKESQEAVIAALDASGLDAKDKAKFISTIKNTQTGRQLRAAAPKIIDRVERLLSADQVRKQKSRIKKLLSSKSIKPKAQSGKKVGKFDAATQERLEELKALNKISGKADEETGVSPAGELLEQRLEAGLDDPLGNAILHIKDKSVTVDFVANAADGIAAIRQYGVEEAEKRLNSRRQEAKEIRETIEQFVDPEQKLLSQKTTGFKGASKKTVKKARNAVAWATESWNDYIDRSAPEAAREKLELGELVSQKKQIQRVMQQKMSDSAKEIYGGKSKDVSDFLDGSGKVEDLGVFVNMNGEEIRVEISKAQARKLWMEYQSTRIRESTLQSENGNAYTDDMLKAMFDILSPQDIQFAQAQLDIYEDFYADINDVYSRVFGVNLGKEEFYSPISRETDKEETTDPFLREVSFRRALAAGSATKMRDQNAIAPLKRRSDIGVFNSHVSEMAHFIAFREKTMLLNDVFGEKKLRRKLEAKFGEGYLKHLDKLMENIAGQGMQDTTPITKFINYFNKNFATAVIGGKAKIGVTQLSSYFSYGEYLDGGTVSAGKALVDGSRDFILNYKEAVKILSKSELLINRGASPDVDIARMGQTFDVDFLRKVAKKKENFIDYTMIFTKLGDRGTIYMGGWAVYKQAIDSGATPKQAMAAFEKATAQTQQSKDIDQLSLMQSEKALGRTLSMFQSAPFAQFRGEIRALRRFFFKKEITKAEFGKAILIYHVLIPQFYRALSNGLLFGEFDEEDQLWTLGLGSLNAIPIVSEIINIMVRKAQGKSYSAGDFFPWMRTITEAVSDGYEAIVSGGQGDFELAAEYLGDTAMGVGTLAGFPVPATEQFLEGVSDTGYGDTKMGLMKMFGHPDSIAEGD